MALSAPVTALRGPEPQPLPGWEAPQTRPSSLRRSRLAFGALCAYLASQAFTIPLVAAGPNWALWPTLPDLAFLLALAALLLEGGAGRRMTTAARRLWYRFAWVVLAAGASIALHPVLFPVAGASDAERWASVPYGAYQLVRLAQFWVVFGIAASVPLDARRLRLLRWLVGAVFLWTVVLVALTYSGLVRPALFSEHLPTDPGIAGPWPSYRFAEREGLGTVGYNHGYPGLQIMALGGLVLLLRAGRGGLVSSATLLLGAVGCFLTGSRAAFAGWALLCMVQNLRRPAVLLVTVLALTAGSLFAPHQENPELFAPAAERQSTLARAYDPESLSGRDELWRSRLEALSDDPIRWVVGWGFGSAATHGVNAHQQLLQLIVEAGLPALLAFFALLLPALRALWHVGSGGHEAFWVTLALLATGLTQETFYPVTAFGHFLGLYLCLLGIALAPPAAEPLLEAAPEQDWRSHALT